MNRVTARWAPHAGYALARATLNRPGLFEDAAMGKLRGIRLPPRKIQALGIFLCAMSGSHKSSFNFL
jgi:hypothetical protein